MFNREPAVCPGCGSGESCEFYTVLKTRILKYLANEEAEWERRQAFPRAPLVAGELSSDLRFLTHEISFVLLHRVLSHDGKT